MTNYIKADVSRILRKNSFFTAVGLFLLLYIIMVFIYFNPSFTAEMYVAKLTSYLSYYPLIVGLLVFICVYVDDFKCKSMQTAIGYGFSRTRIIVAKLLESSLLLLGVGIIMALVVNIVPILIGLDIDSIQHLNLTLTMMVEVLRTIGYIAISAIAVFASQNATNGIIFYVLFSTKSVYIVLSMILGQDIIVNTIGDLTKYLYTQQLYTIKTAIIYQETSVVAFIVSIMVYVIVPTIISNIIFKKKELEF